MRVSFVLPGMHRVQRGAEIAFESIANELGRSGQDHVTVYGSGPEKPDRTYEYRRRNVITRDKFERYSKFPPFRSESVFEEFSWLMPGGQKIELGDTDLTVACSFPFVNWYLTRSPIGRRPPHVFVTQNGDWPSHSNRGEARFFRCAGLVCTNPVYFERNHRRWPSVLIPNGVDVARFSPGASTRALFDLPEDRQVVLMACALDPHKRVIEGLRALAAIPDVVVVIAGDGPTRREVIQVADELLPGRVKQLVLPSERMPDLYRSVDVLLHPTLWESFGNVYVEALVSGLPVVAHDYDVTRWIYGSHPGLVDARDERQLTQAVQSALENGKSDARARVSEAATRFCWPSIAQQYREFFAEVIDGGP